MQCPRCGSQIDNGYIYCNNCGFQLGNHVKGNALKYIYIVLSIIGIMASVAIVILLFNNNSKPKENTTKLIERTIVKEPEYSDSKIENNSEIKKNEANNLNTHINNNISIEEKKNIINKNKIENINEEGVKSTEEIKNSIKSNFNVTASSYLNPQDGFTYYPENLLDNNLSTAWNLPSRGIGEWVEFKADKDYIVNGISIMNGYTKSEDIFSKNNRVKDISIYINNKVYNFTLEDIYRKTQEIRFSTPELTDTIKIQIDSVYDGIKYDEACISEIDIY